MIRADASITIDRPVDVVYAYVVDGFFVNYPRWSPEVVELERLDTGAFDLATRGRQVRVDRGHRSETEFRVTHLEPGRCVEFAGERDASFVVRYEFEPADGHATLLSLGFELQRVEWYMRPFARPIRRAILEGTERTVHTIKSLVENDR